MSRPKRALVIDDDPSLLDLVRYELEKEGFEVRAAKSAEEGLDLLSELTPELVVLDLHLPGLSGLEFLKSCQKNFPNLPVIVLTAEERVDEVVQCMRLGAFDYVQKPFEPTRLLTSVRNAYGHCDLRRKLECVTDELRRDQGFAALLGHSPQLVETIALLRRAAESDVSVLLTGEGGTGKQIAARALHAESPRRSGPFIAVNCGGIPANLIESELFGHEVGTPNGVGRMRVGRLEQADSGTLFLDEVDALRPDLQVRLLRVLQDQVIDRVGGSDSIRVDVRIIASTCRDLRSCVVLGTFREDLYYRLAVFPVVVPPLRERQGDLELLALGFLDRYSAIHQRKIKGVELKAWDALLAYPWPGNIRELMSVIERCVIIEDHELITLASLPHEISATLETKAEPTCLETDVAADDHGSRPLRSNLSRPSSANQPLLGIGAEACETATQLGLCRTANLESASSNQEVVPFETQESRIIRQALARCNWNVKLAARKLGLGRATIYRKIEKYGLNRQPNLN